MVQIGKSGENNTLQQRGHVLYRICADSESHCPVHSCFQWIQKVFLFSIRVILLCVFCEGSNNNNKLLQSLWCSKTPDFFFFFLRIRIVDLLNKPERDQRRRPSPHRPSCWA